MARNNFFLHCLPQFLVKLSKQITQATQYTAADMNSHIFLNNKRCSHKHLLRQSWPYKFTNINILSQNDKLEAKIFKKGGKKKENYKTK